MAHYVYVARCADDSLYTGYATNVARRIAEHNGVAARPGARYTRGRRPVTVVWSEVHATRAAAQTREAAIKRLSRTGKLALIAGT